MALVDQSKSYAAMYSLLELGRFHVAERFGIEEVDTAQLQAFLVARAWRTERAVWAERGTTFVSIRPHGEPLPAHVEWSNTYDGLTLAPLDLLGGERTFRVLDLAAAVEEGANPSGFDMQIGWRLTAEGRQPGIGRPRLLSGPTSGLDKRDFGELLMEQCEWASQQEDRPWRYLLAKRYAQAGWGNLERHDRLSTDREVEHIGYGPGGKRMSVLTNHPEVLGPHGFLPLGTCVTTAGHLTYAMAVAKVRSLGSVVAAGNTDSLVVPVDAAASFFECPGAPDGKFRHLTPAELDDMRESFKPLGVSWKIEVPPTMAVVLGSNKAVFGQRQANGSWGIVRPSDTQLGDLADPSDTPGLCLPDGRRAWVAEMQKTVLAWAASPEGADLSRLPTV